MVILGVASASDFAGLPQLLKSGWKNSDNFLQEWDKKNRILWVTLFEVPLCGHGTLAASAALQKFGNENRSGPQRVQTQVLFNSHLFTQDIIWTLKNADFFDFKLKLGFYRMSTMDQSGFTYNLAAQKYRNSNFHQYILTVTLILILKVPQKCL